MDAHASDPRANAHYIELNKEVWPGAQLNVSRCLDESRASMSQFLYVTGALDVFMSLCTNSLNVSMSRCVARPRCLDVPIYRAPSKPRCPDLPRALDV
jgi:hypothetical protein